MSSKKNNNKKKSNNQDETLEKNNSKNIIIGVVVVLVVLIAFFSTNQAKTDSNLETNQEIEQNQGDLETTDTNEEFQTLGVSESGYEITHTGTITVDGNKEMKFELYGKEAPVTVENFINLAQSGFYENIIFHRIIEGFMIQGGDPNGTGQGGSGVTIKGEFLINGVANPISHTKGIMSMARSGEYDSASSQFFIVHEDSVFLDGSYAGFGCITEGIGVVDQLATVETGANDKPLEDVVITSIVID